MQKWDVKIKVVYICIYTLQTDSIKIKWVFVCFCCSMWRRSKKLISCFVGKGGLCGVDCALIHFFQVLKSQVRWHRQYVWFIKICFILEYHTHDSGSGQQCLIAYRYWPMRWLIGYWSKEFGRDGMLLWVPVAVNSRSVGLLLTYKNRTWKWISRIKYERCIYR